MSVDQQLSFHHITLTHPQPDKKPILDDISGSIPLNKLTAIWGPTGSGKTSLLNTIAFHAPFIKNSILQGEIFYQNHSLTSFPQSAYVEQEDILFGTLTVKEILEYAYDF
jgi:ABC-type multidrug transport system ATPase subunit